MGLSAPEETLVALGLASYTKPCSYFMNETQAYVSGSCDVVGWFTPKYHQQCGLVCTTAPAVWAGSHQSTISSVLKGRLSKEQ